MNIATLNRHRAGLLRKMESSDKRGAALILEIIIYLVIVALIAVAVTSGVQAIRDLVFTSHAKGDIQNVQSWAEGKYTQDNKYPGTSTGQVVSYSAATAAVGTVGQPGYVAAQPAAGFQDAPTLTEANGVTNSAKIAAANGASSGYCILVTSASISDANKNKFWLISTNPAKIYQSGTATNGANLTTAPASGITGVTCPAS